MSELTTGRVVANAYDEEHENHLVEYWVSQGYRLVSSTVINHPNGTQHKELLFVR